MTVTRQLRLRHKNECNSKTSVMFVLITKCYMIAVRCWTLPVDINVTNWYLDYLARLVGELCVCMCVRVYVCACVLLLLLYVCVYVCMFVRACVFACACVWEYVRAFVHVYCQLCSSESKLFATLRHTGLHPYAKMEHSIQIPELSVTNTTIGSEAHAQYIIDLMCFFC